MANLATHIKHVESAYTRTKMDLYQLNPAFQGHEFVIVHAMDMKGLFRPEENTQMFGNGDPCACTIFPSDFDGNMKGMPIHEAKSTLSHDEAFAGIGYHIAGRSFGG